MLTKQRIFFQINECQFIKILYQKHTSINKSDFEINFNINKDLSQNKKPELALKEKIRSRKRTFKLQLIMNKDRNLFPNQ